MERTIFGIFALWLSKKQELDFSVGREISTDINSNELETLANQYKVSNNVVKLAYSMWTVAKPTQKIIERICQKATKLNNKDKVFLYNSLCSPQDMVFENTDHNKKACRGDKSEQVAKESAEIGLYSVSDDFFFNDKDFGFMSFNEFRNLELTFAINGWFSLGK